MGINMTTYELSPDQFNELMRRLGRNCGAFDDLMAHVGAEGSFSRTYLVRGNNPGEVDGLGLRAVANNGQGSVAQAEVYLNKFTGSPSRYVVSTEDPQVQAALRDMGVREGRSSMPAFNDEQVQRLVSWLRSPEVQQVLSSVRDLLRSERGPEMLREMDPQRRRMMSEMMRQFYDASRQLAGELPREERQSPRPRRTE
jgi:hypothetical protein